MISSTPASHPIYAEATDTNQDAISSIVLLGKLLSDETRVRILTMLVEHGELCVRELWERLSQTQPGVSHHLALLRDGGLVTSHQVGRNIYYRIRNDGVIRLLAEVRRTPIGQHVEAMLTP